MKFSAFVRIRPTGTEDRLRSDDPDLDAILALASEPLPPDQGEGLLTADDAFDIFDLDDQERERATERQGLQFRVLH